MDSSVGGAEGVIRRTCAPLCGLGGRAEDSEEGGRCGGVQLSRESPAGSQRPLQRLSPATAPGRGRRLRVMMMKHIETCRLPSRRRTTPDQNWLPDGGPQNAGDDSVDSLMKPASSSRAATRHPAEAGCRTAARRVPMMTEPASLKDVYSPQGPVK